MAKVGFPGKVGEEGVSPSRRVLDEKDVLTSRIGKVISHPLDAQRLLLHLRSMLAVCARARVFTPHVDFRKIFYIPREARALLHSGSNLGCISLSNRICSFK